MIRLSGLRKPRIVQIDQPVIAQLRGINRTRKRNHRCPAGFYPKTHSSFSSHLTWNVTGTVTAPSRPGADFHCRKVFIAAWPKNFYQVEWLSWALVTLPFPL